MFSCINTDIHIRLRRYMHDKLGPCCTHNYTHDIDSLTRTYIIHMYTLKCMHMHIQTQRARTHTCRHSFNHIFRRTSGISSASCSQDLIVAFMMGTHARLNADSPLGLLDDHLVACIAQMAIADRWCVRSCAHQHAFISFCGRKHVCFMFTCMYLCVFVCVCA